MYAVNFFRTVICNHSFILTRPLLFSRHCLQSNRYFVHILNKPIRCESHLLCKNLTRVSFSAHSSPDDNHNVSKGKSSKKRRRIISNSSSDESENDKPATAENIK